MIRTIGIKDDVIQKALNTFLSVPGRLQLHNLKNGARAFVDYAHNPSSFEAVLKTLRLLTSHLIVVFGCGGDRDKIKRPIMGFIATNYGDEVICGKSSRPKQSCLMPGLSQTAHFIVAPHKMSLVVLSIQLIPFCLCASNCIRLRKS